MSWPLSQDYNEAIQCPHDNFRDPDLQKGEAVTNSLGIPMPCTGNFADVYEMRCPNGERWAVKCFTREVPKLRERYAAISRHLQDAKLFFTVDFTFLEQGIRVGGRWYPVLKMQWVEGLTLNEFVRRDALKARMMESLLEIWVRMAGRLREAGIAHADLQHGNVLLVPYGTTNALAVKLVDYDGMFVPALAGIPSGEVGHPCYQHPRRLAERTYSLEVDRFPLLLVATALDCLRVVGRALWDRYDTGDNLLFREVDLRAPVKSPLFYELLKLGDARGQRLATQTLDALKGRLESVPLLKELLPELHTPAAPKPVAAAAKPKRAKVVKAAVAQAAAPTRPTAPTAEASAWWNVESEDKPRSRRRQKGGRLRWVGCAAIASVAGMVLAGGIVARRLGNESEKPTVAVGIASNDSRTSSQPSTAPQQSGTSQESSEAKKEEVEGEGPPKDVAADPPPATSEEPKPKVPEDSPSEKPTDSPKPQLNLSADSSVAELRQALRHEDPDVQAKAAELLAGLGPKAEPAFDELAQVLTNAKNATKVRRSAAFALAHIGPAAKPAVPAVVKALKSESLDVRQCAAEALAQIKYPANEAAIPAIVAAIDNDADPLVRQKCIWALFGMNDRKTFVACGADMALTNLLEEPAENLVLVRYDAARKLANILEDKAPDKSVHALLDMLKNKTLTS